MDRLWLTSESFWLSWNVKWSQVQRGDVWFLHIVPWLALVMLLMRPLVESRIAHVLGVYCSISDERCAPPQHNAVLQKAYWFGRVRTPRESELVELSKKAGWSVFRVHKWFWRTRNYLKPSTLTKFKESFWRCLAYAATSVFGFAVLIQEPFFWDLSYCYRDYPKNTPSQPVLLYWSVQFAFYTTLLVSQFNDVKRKDFYQMTLHHVVTLALVVTAYIINFMQLGVLILLIHDISDVPLELAKLLHYAGKQRLAEVTFAVFAISFFIARLIIFPFWLVRSMAFESPKFIQMFPALRFSIALLLVLQILHMYWFHLIVKMVVKMGNGKQQGDARSDTELSSCDEETFKKDQ